MNSIPLVFVLTLAAIASMNGGEVKTPLSIKYPPPPFEGTPKPIRLPEYDPAPRNPVQMLVPQGTALLSSGKPVKSSEDSPVMGDFAFVTDGDCTGADGAILELGPGRHWVQIDLGAVARIHVVAVWHAFADGRAYHDVIVQLSDDPNFERGVTTIFNNDGDNSSKLGRGRDRPYVESRYGRLMDAKGITARYVRLYSNGSTSDEMNHYAEVEVFGEPIKPAAADAKKP